MNLLKDNDKKAEISPEKSQKFSDNNGHSDNTTDSATDSENYQEKEENEIVQEVEDIPVPKYMIRMLNLMREITIFCVLIVAYAAVKNNPPKILKAPAAYPFFPKDSYVTDWYRGQISQAIEHARTSDVAFVMFYAPWDAESQAAKKEFEFTAKYMHNYVTFATVNCWQPNGECRVQYSKVYKWPVLIAYPSFGRGVQYNGPISAHHMIKFLQKVCRPLERAGDRIMDVGDAYVVAELNTLPGSLEFAVFYAAALKYLEKDSLSRITFYVKPKAESTLVLSLHMWNETTTSVVFKENDWRPEGILQWIFKHVHQSTTWVAPSGTKSLLLSNYVQPGPTLILFTPKNPLLNSIDYYSMLQEIAQEYKNCDNNVINFDILAKRLKNIFEHNYLDKTCRMKQSFSKTKTISHISEKLWANSSNCGINNQKNKDCRLTLENTISHLCQSFKTEPYIELEPIQEKSNKVCDENKIEIVNYFKTSMVTGKNDLRSTENLAKLLHKEKCRQFLTAQKIHPSIFEENDTSQDKISLFGLTCKTNSSLTFVAMDSLLHYHFAEKLGVDLSKQKDKSSVIIINNKMETHYIMDGPINSVTLRHFIHNFTLNLLPRSLNSSTTVESKNTHSYSIKNDNSKEESLFVVDELNSQTFLPTVLEENKAVIVFYYTRQCSFCNGISYTFLTVAKKLSFIYGIKFARIDGDLNILPWEYTMEKYPRILFFPSYRKSESRVFPSSLPITVPNLTGFILTNLNSRLRLHAMYLICNETQLQEEKSLCFSSLRGETLNLIENTLRDWRKSNKRQKQILLHNLKQLKQLHLLFGHSPEQYRLINSYLKKLYIKNSKDYNLKKDNITLKDEL